MEPHNEDELEKERTQSEKKQVSFDIKQIYN